MLIGSQDGQLSAGIGTKRQCRCDNATEVVRLLGFPTASGNLTGQAVGPDLVLIDRPAEIESGVAIAP